MGTDIRNRHESLGLTDQDLIKMYTFMLLARKIDERMWLLNRAGKIPFVVSCQGQEAAQVGAGYALQPGTDFLLPYYRDLGIVLVWGQTARDIMLSAFAKAEDPNSAGRQMPGHFGSRKLRIVSGSSPVSTQIPHAVGVALAAKMKGERVVVYTSFGEGSSNQGDFHEGLNFAGVHRLPVIFFCENNKYAISVPLSKQLACENVADRAAGYGMPGIVVDGNDVLDVYRVVREAAQRARDGLGPSLIEAKTYRLVPHSSDDDDRSYRSREEVEEARKGDPILRFRAYLLRQGVLDDRLHEELQHHVDRQVDEAVEYAENAPYPKPEDTLLHVYGSGQSDVGEGFAWR
jgi:2-oxoisovalerate dehydrogenase E1 component alpha subunit